ncbi:hypothetical protein PQX77_014062 [Marasmius sp. AFHP31]|nr:hypothetical protein PQX77_014062 [Marasmius sp. AFHP31]
MPAHRRHKTKKDQQQATKDKHKRYYQCNEDEIRAKWRERYVKEKALERKERKAAIEEGKRVFWEETAHTEYKRNTLEELRNLEKKINAYISNSGSAYLKRSYHEYLAWTQSAVRQNEPSPLELSYKTFNSMLDAVAKIGNGILNEFGAGKEWKECQRLTRRIRYLIQCIDDLEIADLEQQSGLVPTGFSVLEDRYLKGKLQFQDTATSQWLDRNRSPSVEPYTSSQLRALDEIDPPLVMHQSTTPTPATTPRKRHIQPTDRASPTIHRLAEERKQMHDAPQPTSNQHTQPHQHTQPQPPHQHAQPQLAQPQLGPPVPQTAVPMATTHSYDSVSSLGPPAVHSLPSRKSTSPGPLGYGQPPSTSPTPFGFPAPSSGPYAAGHTYSYPPQSAAHIYPGAAAAYGYQYGFGPHPTVPHPPSRPTSTSGHPTHPPPQSPFPHVRLTVPGETNHSTVVNPASTSTSKPSTTTTAPPAPNAVLQENVPNDKASSTSISEPLAPAPPVSKGALDDDDDDVASKPNDEDNSSDNGSISGDDENPHLSFRAASRVGGRPSQRKIDAADQLCQKVIAYIARKCVEEDTEQTLVWDRLCGRIVKMKSVPHKWNEYQSYASDPEHRATELGHLNGTDLAWDGVASPTSRQLKEAWRLFKEEHGLQEAKAMMGMWSMMKGIVTTQTQGERKRDFVGVQKQLVDLINWVYNRFNIHIWAILAGGLNRSDQTFSSLCELNASKGFSKVLGVEPNEVGPLYQAHICFQNALRVSNQQFAAMGATRGLKVTGPGINEEPLVGSLPTTLLPPPRAETASPKKLKKEDV